MFGIDWGVIIFLVNLELKKLGRDVVKVEWKSVPQEVLVIATPQWPVVGCCRSRADHVGQN